MNEVTLSINQRSPGKEYFLKAMLDRFKYVLYI